MSEIATICPDRWKLAGQKAGSFKVLEDKDKHVRYFVRFVRQLFTFRTSFQGTRLQSANRVRSPIIKTTLSGTHTCPYPINIHQIDKKIKIDILGSQSSESWSDQPWSGTHSQGSEYRNSNQKCVFSTSRLRTV